jgi:hypothetical protein
MFRGGDYMHVSDLLYKCTRKIAISHKQSTPPPDEMIFPAQGITFAQGHAIGDFIVNRVQQKQPSALYGNFKCPCKKLNVLGVWSVVRRGKHVCDNCGHPPEKYHEVTLVNEECMMVGNVDLMLMIDEHIHLTELKSMASHLWDALERPSPEHKAQALIYWWMARELGMPIHDRLSIMYASKGYSMKSPYKEFVIRPSLEMSFIEDHLEDARAYGAYRRGGALPPRIQCATNKAPQAKKCHVCNSCFAK